MSKSVNLKGGNNILFSLKNCEKPVFSLFRYLEIFLPRNFFWRFFVRVYYMCMQNFLPIFQLFFRFLQAKNPKIFKFCNFWFNGLQKNCYLTPKKMLSRSWNFFGASTTVPKSNFGPWFICPCHNMAMSPAKRQFSGHFFPFFDFWRQFWVLKVLRFWWNFAWRYFIMWSIFSKNFVQIGEL